ncbi:MAG: TetR/AcrR family transcriptional regulator, cholesterol catabolism regulator [Blastocatellia bacterium]|jgi:AcrR family transcriptional regulator|nr:TetR/AcrR family transcriptional regulator, cholesterol catabolism regulator [Blastocatellia bacterium]
MMNSLPEDFSRYDQKLEFILRTSARIFAEKGYHSTSMRDISRATKVSLAGLYYYCRSKEELLYLIQDNCFGHVLERLERRLRETKEPLEKLRFVIENHLSFFAANMSEMKVLSHEAESLAGEMRQQVSGKKQQYTRLVRKILSEVQSSHAREEGGAQKIDLTVGTYALFGMMNWIYNWYDPSGKLSVGDLVDNMTRLFLNGFLAGNMVHELQFASKARKAERLSVWRAPQN